MRDLTVKPRRAAGTWARRLARRLAPHLPSRVRPNHVTVARLIIGLAACGLLATGHRAGALGAGAFWLAAVFLDRLDGELARATGTTSSLGHRLDYFADMVILSGFFLALGIGHGGVRGVWIGSLAGVAVAFIQVAAEAIDEDQAGTGRKAFAGGAGFDPEDSHAFFVIFILFAWEAAFLYAAAIGAPLFAAFMAFRLAKLWNRRRPGSAAAKSTLPQAESRRSGTATAASIGRVDRAS